MPKFTQTLDPNLYNTLIKIAKDQEIEIQELIRTVIIPQWLMKEATRKDMENSIHELAKVVFSYQR